MRASCIHFLAKLMEDSRLLARCTDSRADPPSSSSNHASRRAEYWTSLQTEKQTGKFQYYSNLFILMRLLHMHIMNQMHELKWWFSLVF